MSVPNVSLQLPENSSPVEKSSSTPDVSHAGSFRELGEAAKDVVKEGVMGPRQLDTMVYHGRTAERDEGKT